MPKYLIEASQTAEGVSGIAQKGGPARQEAVRQLLAAGGGKLKSLYFAFGGADLYPLVELTGDEATVAIALSINRSGFTKIRTTPLLTPAQVAAAADISLEYRRPGA